MVKEEKLSLDIKAIENLLPHSYPFVQVDRVTEVVAGKYAKGYKNVSRNEEFFNGHFPGVPIMPGVLQLEALAQLSCITVLTMPEYSEGYIGLFTSVENFKFKKKVVPGDKLELETTITKFRFPFGKCDIIATVDGEVTCKGSISFAMAKKEVLEEE